MLESTKKYPIFCHQTDKEIYNTYCKSISTNNNIEKVEKERNTFEIQKNFGRDFLFFIRLCWIYAVRRL